MKKFFVIVMFFILGVVFGEIDNYVILFWDNNLEFI